MEIHRISIIFIIAEKFHRRRKRGLLGSPFEFSWNSPENHGFWPEALCSSFPRHMKQKRQRSKETNFNSPELWRKHRGNWPELPFLTHCQTHRFGHHSRDGASKGNYMIHIQRLINSKSLEESLPCFAWSKSIRSSASSGEMEMILNRDGNDSENGYGPWVTLRLKFQIWGSIFFFLKFRQPSLLSKNEKSQMVLLSWQHFTYPNSLDENQVYVDTCDCDMWRKNFFFVKKKNNDSGLAT